MQCSKCGSSISDNANFCRICGNRVEKNKAVTSMYSSINDQEQRPTITKNSIKAEEKSNYMHFPIWVPIVLFIVIAPIVFFIILGVNSVGKENPIEEIDEKQIQLHHDEAMKCAELELKNKLYYVMEADHKIHYDSKIVDEDEYGRYYIEVTVTTKSTWGKVQSQLYSLVIYDVKDEETYKIDEKNGIMTSFTSLRGSDKNAFLEWNEWGEPI